MTLDDYLKTLGGEPERENFAVRCGTSLGYLYHVAKGRRTASGVLAIAIERESDGQVICEKTCPSADWDYIRKSGENSAA